MMNRMSEKTSMLSLDNGQAPVFEPVQSIIVGPAQPMPASAETNTFSPSEPSRFLIHQIAAQARHQPAAAATPAAVAAGSTEDELMRTISDGVRPRSIPSTKIDRAWSRFD